MGAANTIVKRLVVLVAVFGAWAAGSIAATFAVFILTNEGGHPDNNIALIPLFAGFIGFLVHAAVLALRWGIPDPGHQPKADMSKPRLAKAHAQTVADEYLRLGWTLVYESRHPDSKEPIEFIFEWRPPGEPRSIDWPDFEKRHSS